MDTFQDEIYEYPSAISPPSKIPSPSSVQRPPFFRTRNPKTPLYPSRCYALPPVDCMYERKAVEERPDGTEELFPKDPLKCIKFIGVNAVSFDEDNPSTFLSPLSREVSVFLMFKYRSAARYSTRKSERPSPSSRMRKHFETILSWIV